MFNKKNTIIIALIAIFILGTVLLNASYVDIQVSNVYSRNWGHDEVIFTGVGSNHTIYEESQELYNLSRPYYTFYDVYCYESMYVCEAEQGVRSVTGNRYSSQSKWTFLLPGQWEPIPDDPPDPD